MALFGAIELGAVPVALHVRESEHTLCAVLVRLGPTALVYDASLEELAATLAGGYGREIDPGAQCGGP